MPRFAVLFVAAALFVAAFAPVDALPLVRQRIKRQQQQLSGRSSATSSRTGVQTRVVPRDTKAGVTLVRDFDAALKLPADRQKAKEQLLSSDAFVFFRASPKLYHSDVSRAAANAKNVHSKLAALLVDGRPGPMVPTSNDIHAANFGTFRAISKTGAGADGAFFGINDYDQATPASDRIPVDVDLTRFATSIVLAARNIGASEADQQKLAGLVFDEYMQEASELMTDGPKLPFLAVDSKAAKGKVKALLTSAAAAKRKDFLDKYSRGSGQSRRLQCGDAKYPDLKPVTDNNVLRFLPTVLPTHRDLGFTPNSVLQICEKLNSGGSSFGLPRYWLLVTNPNGADKEPYLFEVKQLLPPSTHPALATADIKKLAQAQSELMGGLVQNTIRYVTAAWDNSKPYLVREVEPEKDSLNLATLTVTDMEDFIGAACRVLARAHTQGGQKERARGIAEGWLPVKDRASARKRLIEFAVQYAHQVVADHAAYKDAVAAKKF